MGQWLQRVLEVSGGTVALLGLSHLVCKFRHAIVPLLILILPVQKDGPLDIDLGTWKLVLVALLVFCTVGDRSAVQGSRLYPNSLFLVIGGIAASLASYSLSARQDLSAPLTQSYLTSALFFILLCKILDARLLRMAIRSIILLTIGVCAVAFMQYATIVFHLDHPGLLRVIPPQARAYYFDLGNAVGEMGVRLPSVFFHPNQLGHVLGMSFGFLLPLLLSAKTLRDKIVCLVTLLMIGACTFLTLSRGAVLVMAVETAAVLALVSKTAVKNSRALLAAGAFLFTAMFLLIQNAAPLLTRFVSSGLSFRGILWSRAAELMPEHYLFGVGPGCSSFEILTRFPPVDPSSLLSAYYIGHGYDLWGSAPHNYYLTTVLEGGIFSLAFRLILYLTLGRLSIGLIRRLKHNVHRSLAVAAAVPLWCEFLRGSFDSYNFLSSTESGALAAFFLATALYLDSRHGGKSRLRWLAAARTSAQSK